MTAKDDSKKPWVVETQDEVAAFFGVTKKTVVEWAKKGMPRSFTEKNTQTRWAYDLSEVFQWYKSFKMSSTGAASREVQSSKADLEVEKLKVQIAKAKLEYMQSAGELVSRQASKAIVANILNRVRARLDAFPEMLGSGLPPDLRSAQIAAAKHQVRMLELDISKWAESERTMVS